MDPQHSPSDPATTTPVSAGIDGTPPPLCSATTRGDLDPTILAGKDLLTDTALVMRSRHQLDRACLDVLTAPGMGGLALEALATFITGPQIKDSLAAMERIALASTVLDHAPVTGVRPDPDPQAPLMNRRSIRSARPGEGDCR